MERGWISDISNQISGSGWEERDRVGVGSSRVKE